MTYYLIFGIKSSHFCNCNRILINYINSIASMDFIENNQQKTHQEAKVAQNYLYSSFPYLFPQNNEFYNNFPAQTLGNSSYQFSSPWERNLNEMYSQALISLNENFCIIESLHKKTIQNQLVLNQTNTFLIQQQKQIQKTNNIKTQEKKPILASILSEHLLVNTLFGSKSYHYQLKLKHKTRQVLYKERQFNLHLSLLDSQGNQVRNTNAVNLYLFACDYNGNILANENKQSFFQGKLKVELLNGQAFFEKISASTITRYLPKKLLAIMIYARYSSKNSYGNKIIDFNDIMPLCLERISVHSKKMRIGDDEEYKL